MLKCRYRKGTTMRNIIVNPKTGGAKGTKPARHDLIPPEALHVLAEQYGYGASIYGDNNWRKGYNWSLAYAAMQRHANAFWAGETDDPDTNLPHMAAVAFHALTLITYTTHNWYSQFDDRPKPPEGDPNRPANNETSTSPTS